MHMNLYLGGQWVETRQTIHVSSPYDDSTVGTVAAASAADFTQAIELGRQAFAQTRKLSAYARERACLQIADGIQAHHEELSVLMSRELGKALKDSRAEVSRAVGVFRTSAEEAKRVGGEILDLDWNPGSEGRLGLLRRFPKGVIAGITPFNFPLNLIAHKIGPAIASGNAIIIKPASKTPLIALKLAEIIDTTDYPKGAVSILPAASSETIPLLQDERVKLITFTGSDIVGWWIKDHAGRKPVVLELGGNAGVAVADDADLDWATSRLVFGAFASAGQSCISVQRIYLHESIYDRALASFVAKTKTLKTGDPLDPTTDVGALVDTAAVEKTMQSLDEAKRSGGKILCGGTVTGRVMEPTILTDVPRHIGLCVTEAFAPVAVVARYSDFKQVVADINDSNFGLQAGIFTNRMSDIMYAWHHIETGGVVVNDVPTYRADHMPYGGVKRSGLGREGIRWAIEDMTEPKLLALKP